MRALPLSSTVAAVLFTLPLAAAADCPAGKEPRITTLPNGKVHTVCVPAAAVGNGPASPSNPVECPCFSKEDITATIASNGGVYAYNTYNFASPIEGGSGCYYREVVTGGIKFFGAMVSATPEIGCFHLLLYPLSTTYPNGCVKLDGVTSLVLNPISIAEASACVADVTAFKK